jgi:hypothetical protein
VVTVAPGRVAAGRRERLDRRGARSVTASPGPEPRTARRVISVAWMLAMGCMEISLRHGPHRFKSSFA